MYNLYIEFVNWYTVIEKYLDHPRRHSGSSRTKYDVSLVNIWEKTNFFIALIAKLNPHVFFIILLRVILEWWLYDTMHYKI